MSLIVETGTILSPAATGTQTYSLGRFGGTTPKAIILWSAWDANVLAPARGNAIFALGFATYRGGAAQQAGATASIKDNVATSVCSSSAPATAIIRLDSTLSGSADCIVSFNSFLADQFKLDWNALPSVRTNFHYVVLGGTAITDAYVGQPAITDGTGNLDLGTAEGLVPASFGQPDLALFASSAVNGVATAATGDAAIALGVGIKDGNTRAAAFHSEHNVAGADADAHTGSKFYERFYTGQTIANDGDLPASSGWPANGLRINRTTAPGGGATLSPAALVLKGTFSAQVGSTTIPTADGTVQSLDFGSAKTPSAAIFWSAFTLSGAAAAGGGFGMGCVGTGGDQASASITETDTSNPTICSRVGRSNKVLSRLKGTGAVDAEATATLPSRGQTLDVTWADAASDANLVYNYLLLAETYTAPSASASKSMLLIGV